MSLFSGKLKVHPLFIPTLIFAVWKFGCERILCFAAALLIHEAGHILGSLAMRAKINSFELLPFGCAADIDEIAYIPASSEMLIAAFGPALSILYSAAICAFDIDDSILTRISADSVSIAAVNLLPAYPLDGGRIVFASLLSAVSPVKALRLTSAAGIILSSGMMLYSLFALHEMPFGMILFSVTILMKSIEGLIHPVSNHVSALEKKSREFKKRGYCRVNSIAVSEDTLPGEMLRELSSRDYNIIRIIGKDMKIKKTLDEGELIGRLFKS